MRITFLGTGTSAGVPVIACECATCRSTDSRDKRWRPSIVVALDDGRIVETGTHSELLLQGGWYADAYATQLSVPSIQEEIKSGG